MMGAGPLLLLASVFICSISTPETEVTELFRADTPEELAVALVDGYPMPWLAEVLADTTIPEKDRYWLDCRMRAAIAIDQHTFFDGSGSPVVYEADWIQPCEPYWRETFILNPPGEEKEPILDQSGQEFLIEPGLIINSHGERIGRTAAAATLMNFSRDGSLGASALCLFRDGYRLVLFYPDGSYFVSPIDMNSGRCTVSQSGEYVFLAARDNHDPWNADNNQPPRAVLLDRHGVIQWSTPLEMTPVGNSTPAISPDDRFCAVAGIFYDQRVNCIQVFLLFDGSQLIRIDSLPATQFSFSPDGTYLAASGFNAASINTSTGQIDWSDNHVSTTDFPIYILSHVQQTNSCDLLSGMVWPTREGGTSGVLMTLFDRTGNVIVSDHAFGSMDISPNGVFVLTEGYLYGRSDQSICPIVIREASKVLSQ